MGTSNLARYGSLYRNDEGHEVWRITGPDGQVIAENVSSDHDAAWIADQITGRRA